MKREDKKVKRVVVTCDGCGKEQKDPSGDRPGWFEIEPRRLGDHQTAKKMEGLRPSYDVCERCVTKLSGELLVKLVKEAHTVCGEPGVTCFELRLTTPNYTQPPR